ncbi:hypothetical protein AMECASPLE_038734, partial [Ameca splendens]
DFDPTTHDTVIYFEPCLIIIVSLQSRMAYKRHMLSVNLLSIMAVIVLLLLMCACKGNIFTNLPASGYN